MGKQRTNTQFVGSSFVLKKKKKQNLKQSIVYGCFKPFKNVIIHENNYIFEIFKQILNFIEISHVS